MVLYFPQSPLLLCENGTRLFFEMVWTVTMVSSIYEKEKWLIYILTLGRKIETLVDSSLCRNHYLPNLEVTQCAFDYNYDNDFD